MNDGLVLAARVAGVGVGFPLLTWAFGSAVLARFTRLDREERFVASFGLGFAAQALGAFWAFVLHGPQPPFSGFAVALLLGIALWCRLTAAKRPADDAPFPWPLAAVFALCYLHLVCIQALLPDYRGSYWYFDWWMHYDEALVFVGDRPVTTTWAYPQAYTLASRTPLLNLTAAFVMGLAGHGFDTYQLACALTNSCFPLALYLLLRDLFGRRAAWLAVLLVPLNVWMLHNAWFTWSKMLAAYYLILALYFYVRSLRCRPANPGRAGEYFVAFGVASVLAYVTHQATLGYVLPLLLHAAVLALWGRAFRPRFADLLACALFAAAVGGSWYGWLAGTLGWDKIVHSTPVTAGNEKIKFSPKEIAKYMEFNVVVSVVPVGIGQAFVTGVEDEEEAPPRAVEVYRGEKRWFVGPPDLVELHRGVTQLYFSLFTGALTLSLSAFLIAVGVKRLRRGPARSAKAAPLARPVWTAVWLSLFGGTLVGAALHPDKIDWGIAHSAVFPTVLVLVGLAWGLLSRASRTVTAVVCCGTVLEFLLIFWSHWWLLLHHPEVLEHLPGNAGYKGETVVFLNDRLGAGQYVFLAGAVAVQLVLILLLARWWRGDRAGAAEEPS